MSIEFSFKNWLQNELSTSTGSIASFAQPISSGMITRSYPEDMFFKKKKKKLKENFALQPLSRFDSGLDKGIWQTGPFINPNQVLSTNSIWSVESPQDEISLAKYSGPNDSLFYKLFQKYRKTGDREIKIALLQAINGNDYGMYEIYKNKFLKENNENIITSYIDPNELLESNFKGSTAFIYNIDGKLLFSGRGDTHDEIIYKNYDYYGFNFNSLNNSFDPMSALALWSMKKRGELKANNLALLGRITKIKEFPSPVISFWNENKVIYTNKLKDCIGALLANKLIYENCYISTPIFGTVSLVDLIVNFDFLLSQKSQTSSEDIERIEAIHLMNTNQKKQELEKRGVLPKKPRVNVKPGEKWWTPYSESNRF